MSSTPSSSLFENCNFLRTEADGEAAGGASIEPLMGDETGPNDGFLRAGDCKYVLIGDLERGGGIRMLALFRSVRTAVGSGIVPISKSISPFRG